MSSVEYADDGVRIYDSEGNLLGHLGHFEALGGQIAAFSRSSAAYKQDGSQVASGVPRYEDATFGQGLMMEEGTTNLLSTNQSSVETDLTGFMYYNIATLTRITTDRWQGTACLQCSCPGSSSSDAEGFSTAPGIAVGVGTYRGSLYIKGTAGKQLNVRLFDVTHSAVSDNHQVILTGSWQRVTTNALTPDSGSSDFRILVHGWYVGTTEGAYTVYADGLQIEQKPYVTAWQIGGTARAVETLTIPTAGVLSKESWAVEVVWKPSVISTVNNRWLWACYIDSNNYYWLYTQTSGQLTLAAVSGGVWRSQNSSIVCSPGNSYRIMVAGDSSVIRLCINGEQQGSDLAYTEPIGALPASIYIGSRQDGQYQANGIYDDLRISSRARTLAEHQAYVSSGKPHTVDDDTTLLMSMDGTLRPTVRGHGLWDKNGRLILQDPQQGQGLEVWDGGTRKILIGKLDDGTIGQEIVGGKIYANLFSTRGSGLAYAEIDADGNITFYDTQANKCLVLSGGAGQGFIDWFFNGTRYAQAFIDAGTYRDLLFWCYNGAGIRLESDNAALLRIGSGGNSIEMDTQVVHVSNHLDVGGGVYVDGGLYVFGTPKNAIEETSQGPVALAAVESPEVLYVDRKGVAEIAHGECRIDIDPLFEECTIPNSEETPWNIILTPKGPFTLYESEIGDSYFVVKSHDPDVSGKFSWMLFAVRKNFAGVRFQKTPHLEARLQAAKAKRAGLQK